jgi:molecular chaperone GrpE (heat shock protein)
MGKNLVKVANAQGASATQKVENVKVNSVEANRVSNTAPAASSEHNTQHATGNVNAFEIEKKQIELTSKASRITKADADFRNAFRTLFGWHVLTIRRAYTKELITATLRDVDSLNSTAIGAKYTNIAPEYIDRLVEGLESESGITTKISGAETVVKADSSAYNIACALKEVLPTPESAAKAASRHLAEIESQLAAAKAALLAAGKTEDEIKALLGC